MKKQLGYSEFSFGYAFTENLVRSSASGPSSAPRFPNLVEEGSLGYDLRIEDGGFPLFLQYKLPERMVRASAVEISKHRLNRQGLPIPFFRMYLMKKDASRQHEMLIELEQQWPCSVFYAAPFMVGHAEFNSAYVSVAVHKHSVLFSPGQIGSLPDGAQHIVAYHPRVRSAWFCSEPKRIEALGVASVLENRGRALKETHGRRLGSIAREVVQSIVSTRPSELEEVQAVVRGRVRERRRRAAIDAVRREETEEAVEELLVARELAHVGLGVELMLAQSRG